MEIFLEKKEVNQLRTDETLFYVLDNCVIMYHCTVVLVRYSWSRKQLTLISGKVFSNVIQSLFFLFLCVHILDELMISVLRYGKAKLSNVIRMFSLLPGKH